MAGSITPNVPNLSTGRLGLSACNNDVQLDAKFIQSMGTAHVFHGDGKSVINAMSFFADGEFCVSSKSNNVMVLYNALAASERKVVRCDETGVDLVKYTHHQDCVIHSAKKDNHIRYHSFFDNTYLQIFHGHTDKISSLSLCPSSDEFISASADKTVRLWDFRSPKCTSIIEIPHSHPFPNSAVYDPSGAVVAVCAGDRTIRLFDPRKTEGPFLKFPSNINTLEDIMLPYSNDAGQAWFIEKILFNPDGDSIIAITNTAAILQFDSFDGNFQCMYNSHCGPMEYGLDASFSPDGNFLAVGSSCGTVFVYGNGNGEVISEWSGGHIGPITAVEWNPRYEMATTAYMNTVFWLGPALGA